MHIILYLTTPSYALIPWFGIR